jgi:hypothetical protein
MTDTIEDISGDGATEETGTFTCGCGASYESTSGIFSRGPDVKHCPACLAKNLEEVAVKILAEQKAALENRIANFQGAVRDQLPSRLETDDLNHPAFNLGLWSQVAEWKPTPGKPWLGITGGTGSCKSRCAFLWVLEYAKEMASDISCNAFVFQAISGSEFNRTSLDQFSKSSPEFAVQAACQLDRLRRCKVLLFDELAKVRPTPAIIDELFALIDYRHSWNLTTVWTANASPEVFCAKWPDEYREPGFGRILEASTIIKA